jgi:hypothetical protein
MNDQPIGRTRHISITRTTTDGVVSQTEVHITEAPITEVPEPSEETAPVPPDYSRDTASGCFDPTTCCDARERAVIAALRAYLRPDEAPECLMARLKVALDHCCRGEK